MQQVLSRLSELNGFIASSVVDTDTGMMLASEVKGNFAIEMASAANTEVVRAKLRAMKEIGLGNDYIEDVLITLGTQIHIIRPLKTHPTIFIYLAVSINGSNLAMARMAMRKAEESIKL